MRIFLLHGYFGWNTERFLQDVTSGWPGSATPCCFLSISTDFHARRLASNLFKFVCWHEISLRQERHWKRLLPLYYQSSLVSICSVNIYMLPLTSSADDEEWGEKEEEAPLHGVRMKKTTDLFLRRPLTHRNTTNPSRTDGGDKGINQLLLKSYFLLFCFTLL